MTVHSTILKILSLYRYRFIYIALSLVLIILTYENIWYGITLIPFFVYIYRHHKDLLRVIIILNAMFFLSKYMMDQQSIDLSTAQTTLKVIECNKIDDYYTIVGRRNMISVRIYLTDGEGIQVGSYYSFSGEWKVPTSQTIPYGFDYKMYLLSKRTKYILYASSAEFVSKGSSFSQIREMTYHYIEQRMPESKDYIKTFLLADKSDIDQSVIDGVNFMGISHMFAVSGYHIGLLVVALGYIGKKGGVRDHIIEYIIVFLLLLYMIITAFAPSVVRASLLYIFLLINKKLHFDLSVFDILSIIFIILVLLNPYMYHNIGFVLSFYITLILLLSQPILRHKNTFQSLCLVSFIAFLTSFPIVLNMNMEVNLFTLIYNVLFLYVMSFVILPLSYITFVFPVIDGLSSVIFGAFNSLVLVISKIDLFILNGFLDHPVWIILFIFVTWLLLLKMEEHRFSYLILSILITVFLVASNVHLVSPYQRVSFIDVEGDSIVITDAYNRCNIVIDTGEVDRYDSLINYMKARHIRRVDYLIISHFHSDHYGEAEDVLKEFDVKHLVTNQQVQTYENQVLECGNIQLFIYPMTYNDVNENNNSIVLSVLLSGTHYLFAGDSEEEREIEMQDLTFGTVDYLKVSHHGSITSSTEPFLDYIRPIEAIISVRRDNRNDHPSEIVVGRFKDRQIPLYRTDLLGTIEIYYKGSKEEKKYYTP